MKTKLLLTLCCLASAFTVMRAQDIITKRNGDEIKAKVVEINVNEVKYKRFENTSGPTYSIAKSDVFMIKYENGEKDMFSKTSDNSGVSDQRNTQNTSSSESESIKQKLQSNREMLQNPSQGVQSGQKQSAATQQSVPVEKITQFGIKGGLNSAYEQADNGKTDTRNGIHIGFFLETPISPKVGFQPELVYSMQGGGGDNLDYINLPLMFKFYVWEQRFSIDAGPQAGYMISSNYYYDLLNKFEASVCVGASYKFNDKFDISFRVNIGVTKIADDYSYTNTVGQLGVGYRF